MSLLIPTRAITDANVNYPRGYHKGDVGGLSVIDPDLIAENIKYGTTMFGITGTMLQWVYGLILAGLDVPVPSITLAVAEDHSGGGHIATPSTLNIPIPSIVVDAAESWLLIEDCEGAWNEYVAANVTSTADAGDKQVGNASAKMAVADAAGVGRLATEAIASKDLTTYNYIKAWVKSSVAIPAGDLDILLDDTAECVSPLKELDIGGLSAGAWTQVTLPLGDASGLGAIISIGIDMNNDKGAFDFWIDQVRATKGG